MQQLLRQAEMMKKKMEEMKQDLAKREVIGSAGGGMVEVTVNGGFEVIAVRVDPEVVKEGDIEMLQDLFAAACNEATRKIQQTMNEEMGSLTGGLPGMGL